MRCAQCQFDNPPGMKFCVKCGATLALRCPACGAENQPSFTFCGQCGAGLHATEAEDARCRAIPRRILSKRSWCLGGPLKSSASKPRCCSSTSRDSLRSPRSATRKRYTASWIGPLSACWTRCIATKVRSSSSWATALWPYSALRLRTRTIRYGPCTPPSACNEPWVLTATSSWLNGGATFRYAWG